VREPATVRRQISRGLQLAGTAAAALGMIGLDAVRDRRGGALPRSPDRLADPTVLSDLLGRPVRAVSLPGVTFESSNCRNFLVDVEFADGAARSLYAKLPARELGPRVFANVIGYWGVECTFCERVAPQVPIRVPTVAAVRRRNSRFVLLLENLGEDPTVEMFVNRDTAAGTTIERAQRVLSALAELHASFHGLPEPEQDALMPLDDHPYLGDRARRTTRALNAAAIDRSHRAAPEIFTDELAQTYRRTLDQWDAVTAAWFRGPRTLVHGDSHLANCFEYGPEGERRVGMIDFQGAHWSKGIRDVVYFLANSLDTGVLATHEDALIDHYLDELARFGVELDPAETRADYGAFSFQALMVGVIATGLGGFTEQAQTLRTMLTREAATVERLDFAGWLDTLP
jgi:hypothetical protein